MTWAEFSAARQLLAEERLGAPLRAQQRNEIEREDAQVEATKAAIRRYPSIPLEPQAVVPAVIPPRPITDEIVGV